jgi:hypothetical protein
MVKAILGCSKITPSLRCILLLLVISVSHVVHAETPYYIAVLNKTSEELQRVEMYFGDINIASPGIVVKGGTKKEGPITMSIPSLIEVRWVAENQQRKERIEVQRADSKPLSRHSTLDCVFNENSSPEVKIIDEGDLSAKTLLWKGLRKPNEYVFGFVNKTPADLRDVQVYYGTELATSVRDVLIRGGKSYSKPLTLPVPSEAVVKWSQAEVPHEIKVTLKEKVSVN